MSTEAPPSGLRLRLERVIRAPRERVWRAWTDPEEVSLWFYPEGMTIPAASMDFRVGGSWEATIRDERTCELHIAFGTYLEIEPPRKFVQTHQWRREGNRSTVRTTVTVELMEEGASTRVILTQEGFEAEGSVTGHREGWSSTLDRLVLLMEDGGPVEGHG